MAFCPCEGRSGIIHKPSGRVVCGDCGLPLLVPPPPRQERARQFITDRDLGDEA
jgi:hypothetical protein